MRISTKGRYSLEALLYLALLPDGAPASTREIAERTGISERYLEQLFIPLRKNAVIKGTRGAHGGYLLGRDSGAITVGDILRSVDVALDLVACVTTEDCPKKPECGSRQTWSSLYTAINAFVDSVTIRDLTRAYHEFSAPEYVI
jgi:Rrf2 family protein